MPDSGKPTGFAVLRGSTYWATKGKYTMHRCEFYCPECFQTVRSELAATDRWGPLRAEMVHTYVPWCYGGCGADIRITDVADAVPDASPGRDCPSCGQPQWTGLQRPGPDDEAGWILEAEHHRPGCSWLATRGGLLGTSWLPPEK
jgi:hypothetical protein